MGASVAARQVRHYRELVDEEAWKRDHLEAQACWEFEQVLKFGVFVYDELMDIDERIRLEADSSAEELLSIRSCFERWLETCEKVLPVAEAFERRGHMVDHAADLRRRRAEIRWSLGDAKDVLTSDKFTALRDAALDDEAAGKTVEIETRLGA